VRLRELSAAIGRRMRSERAKPSVRLAIEFLNAAISVGWTGPVEAQVIRQLAFRILRGEYGSSPKDICKWLRRNSRGRHGSILVELFHSKMHLQLSAPDQKVLGAERFGELIERSAWNGIELDDQGLMREFLRETNTRAVGGTARVYKSVLSRLAEVMLQSGTERLSDVRPEHVRELLRGCEARNVARSTQHWYLRVIRHFYGWLGEGREGIECPVKGGHFPRVIEPEPQPLEVPQVEAIRSVLDRMVGTQVRAFFYLLYLTGLRPSEALSVRLVDLDRGKMELFVAQGKGGATAFLPIAKFAIDCIDEWLQGCKVPGDCEYIFHSNGFQTPLTAMTDLRKAVIQEAKVRFTWRQLRTTYATRLASYGVSPFVIQRLLRHSRLNTIMTYIAYPESRVRESYAQFAEQLLGDPADIASTNCGTAASLLDT
jgi:site-specific recombinase XerD